MASIIDELRGSKAYFNCLGCKTIETPSIPNRDLNEYERKYQIFYGKHKPCLEK